MKRKILCALTVLALCLAALPALAEEAAEKGTREAPYRLGEACAFTAEILADRLPAPERRRRGLRRRGDDADPGQLPHARVFSGTPTPACTG